jgi:hypothetical protein
MNDRTENDYNVGWSCEITAASPKEAAEIALRMIVDQKAWAHVFDVTNDCGDTVRVDLDDPDDVATGPRLG